MHMDFFCVEVLLQVEHTPAKRLDTVVIEESHASVQNFTVAFIDVLLMIEGLSQECHTLNA